MIWVLLQYTSEYYNCNIWIHVFVTGPVGVGSFLNDSCSDTEGATENENCLRVGRMEYLPIKEEPDVLPTDNYLKTENHSLHAPQFTSKLIYVI